MKTKVSDSSIDNYHDITFQAKASIQRERIIQYLRECMPTAKTGREIARATGIEPSAVAGRLNALREEGLVMRTDTRLKCSITGISVYGHYVEQDNAEG